MGDQGAVPPRPGRRGFFRVALVLSVLAVGLVAGYMLRAATEPAPSPFAPPNASPATSVTPAEPPPPSAPCIAAAQSSDGLLAELDRAVAAMAALDPGALRAAVDEAERLRAEMRRAVDACEAQRGPAPGTDTGPPTAVVPSTPG